MTFPALTSESGDPATRIAAIEARMSSLPFNTKGDIEVTADRIRPGVVGDGVIQIASGADLESQGFTAGSSGWRIRGNGSAEFNNVTVRGTIGDTTLASGADLESENFSAGSAGWRIRGNGNAQFNNVTVRGTLGDVILANGSVFQSQASGDRVEIENDFLRVFGSGGNVTLRGDSLRPTGGFDIRQGNGSTLNVGANFGASSVANYLAGGGTWKVVWARLEGGDIYTESDYLEITSAGAINIGNGAGLNADDAAYTRIRYASSPGLAANGVIFVDSDDNTLKYRSGGSIFTLTGSAP